MTAPPPPPGTGLTKASLLSVSYHTFFEGVLGTQHRHFR